MPPAAEVSAPETSNTPNQDLARGLVEESGPQVAKRDRAKGDGNGDDAGPAWSFAASAPEVYTRGSGAPIALDVPSRLPGDADFLVIAWSHTDKALVTAFDHKLNIKPFRLDQAKLDALPSGRIELQALYRDGSTVELKKHNLVVVGEGEDAKQYNEDADARRRELASKGAASRARRQRVGHAPLDRRLHRLQPLGGHAGDLRLLVHRRRRERRALPRHRGEIRRGRLRTPA